MAHRLDYPTCTASDIRRERRLAAQLGATRTRTDELVVNRQQSAIGEALGDRRHHGDIGNLLIRSEHGHAFALQHPKHARERAGLVGRALPDGGQDRNILGAADFHLVVAQHFFEPGADAVASTIVRALDQVGHPAAGRRLRGEHDFGPVLVECTEHGRCRPGKILQLWHIDREQDQVFHDGDGLQLVTGRLAGHASSRLVRCKGGKNAHGNIERDRWADGARMQHLRSKMRQLLSFLESELGDLSRIRHQPGIGGKHPGHIGPDLHFVGMQGGAEQGRGIIGAAAAERGGRSIRRSADEPGHHDSLAFVEDGPHDRIRLLAGAVAVGPSRAEAAIGADDAVREDRFGGIARRAQGRRHQQTHDFFASGDDAIGEPGGKVASDRHIGQIELQRRMQVFDAIGGVGAVRSVGQALEHRLVFLDDGCHGHGHAAAIAAGGLAACLQQQIGHARCSRNDHRAWGRLGGGKGRGFPNPFE